MITVSLFSVNGINNILFEIQGNLGGACNRNHTRPVVAVALVKKMNFEGANNNLR